MLAMSHWFIEPTFSCSSKVILCRLYILGGRAQKTLISQGSIRGGSLGNEFSPSSSMRALRREREMLCRQMQKKFPEKEREVLYRK
ncbi:hypothetical protein Syun_013681 [Stephania yunnanensis]|uniref:NPK1-activating kinesin-like protein C-terminal domain-containing protein n=1 Tax=Stephania yunnanensis TaxID=152371 RepID=A0AAP0PB59_9MAGN